MNTFNKLYNVILESIITQDIESKIRKAIQTLIQSGQLTGQDDPRAEQVKTIIKRNNSIDINGKTKLDQLLKANQQYIKREQNKDIDLDSIPEFTQKKEYPNGVVIYRVEDNKEGMNAVRKIADAQWGQKTKPWCLITRPMDEAQKYWNKYNAYPKHIAFQNGKLLAFCANDRQQNLWWDRNDHSSPTLKLLDGSQIETQKYKKETKSNKFFITKNHLIYNQETKLYDSEDNVYVQNNDLIDGHFPVKFGVIKGTFYCGKCYDLISLQGAPKEVYGNFICNNIVNLKTLQGAPKFIKGIFDCQGCRNLISLQGAPEEVGSFKCDCCDSLTSLKGISKKIKILSCSFCNELTSLDGINQVEGFIKCNNCRKLILTQEDKNKYKLDIKPYQIFRKNKKRRR